MDRLSDAFTTELLVPSSKALCSCTVKPVLSEDHLGDMEIAIDRYTLTQVFCHKQSFVYVQFYLYCIDKIVNKQRIVWDRISGLRYVAYC